MADLDWSDYAAAAVAAVFLTVGLLFVIALAWRDVEAADDDQL